MSARSVDPDQHVESDDHTFARLDLDRSKRIDLPEAIYSQGKTTEQVDAIADRMLANGTDAVIATRLTDDQAEAMDRRSPQASGHGIRTWRHRPATGHRIAVVSAGTSDLPVADECRLTLTALGHDPYAITDVGVAGLQRLTGVLPEIAEADVIVALAGMEGALPTVLAGLVGAPIIAVPTSVGYGAALEGVTALLSMLASCAPGIAVVGIDNGFGAACAAHRILSSR
ncbi:MAG: nickel pincer cofactor biosynthesis protein LarB [Acidimicrobiales bacterium]